jgi:thiol-disulfide isomerase/thioredoxin
VKTVPTAIAVSALIAAGAASFLIWRVTEPQIVVLPVAPDPSSESAAPNDHRFVPLETPRPVPSVGFTDGDGQPLTLADFHGRAVLLNIWATWCVPCRKEMPALDRVQAKMGSSEFQVVALSIDRQGREIVDRFYRDHGIAALEIYLDRPSAVPHAVNAPGVPITLLIDREGRELGRKIGPAEWDSAEMIRLIQESVGQAMSPKGANGEELHDR